MPTETPTPAATLADEELPLADYRALREGRDVPKLDLSADAVQPTPESAPIDAEPVLEETPKPDAKPDKLAKRFSELTSKIKTLEGQLAAGKTAAPGPDAVAPAAVVPAADPNDVEPAIEKFSDYAEYLREWSRWDRRQESRATAAAQKVAEQKTAATAKAETWQEQIKTASAVREDFESVALNPDLKVTGTMGQAITDSAVGAEILYRLGSTPDEAARISALTPLAQIRAIGKLEAAIEAETEAAADGALADVPLKKAIPVSKAPAPHKPVAGAPAGSPSRNIDSMTQQEYRAYRESGKIR